MSWWLIAIGILLVFEIASGSANLIAIAVTVAICAAVIFPLQRVAHRRAASQALAAGALWGGAAVAQPPNMALGQTANIFVAYTPRYWRNVARGTLSIYPGQILFVPRKPNERRQQFVITPDQVVSVGASRYSYGGVLDVHFRDGNKRRFSMYVGPGQINDTLYQAGFPVS